MRARSSLLLGLGVGLGLGCSRPVDLPASGDTFITDVVVTPEFVRADVPVEISFLSNGLPPVSVTVDIAGEVYDCDPEPLSGGRMRCVRERIERTTPQGVSLVVVKATGEDGAVSTAAGQLHVDFECPSFVSATVSQRIAEAGDSVTVNIEASEILGGPPVVTRQGRDWGTPVGSGASWSLGRQITSEDPSQFADIVIRLRDRAGNTTGDCGTDATIPFAVDLEAPVVDVSGVLLTRGVPSAPAVLQAGPGSFIDDVGIAQVVLFDPSTAPPTQIAAVEVAEDGSIPSQSIGAPTSSRVLLQAVDAFGRRSDQLAVRERWKVTVGNGSTPGAAVKTAIRYTPAPPTTRSMHNRTAELAPDVLQEDARTSVIRATVGFRRVGSLPSRYQDSKRSIAGYDPVGKAMVVVGGYNGPDVESFDFYNGYMSDVQVVRWDEREGVYISEQGPLLSRENPNVPLPRYGHRIAFDTESGCGVMYGGVARTEEFQISVVNDLWRICAQPGGYAWQRIELAPEVDGNCIENYAPIIWDRYNRRYILAGDEAVSCGDTRVMFLQPGATLSDWRWINVQPLPTNFGSHFSNVLYVDPAHRGFSLGLGTVGSGGQVDLAWTYRNGQWTTSRIPRVLEFRSRYGWDYDLARRRLTIWGGNDDSTEDGDPLVWYMTDTSTNGPEAWRSAQLDNPTPRHYATMVYDEDREVMLIFGGVDWQYDPNADFFDRYQPDEPISPDLYELVSQPSFPYMQVVADLAAPEPKGIAQLSLTVRAQGTGDLDGEGPGLERGGGVRVLLWDHVASRWDEVHAVPRDPLAGLETIDVVVNDDPGRYVSPDGTVPVSVAPLRPATEALEGRLEVDVVDGQLELRPGVTLP